MDLIPCERIEEKNIFLIEWMCYLVPLTKVFKGVF